MCSPQGINRELPEKSEGGENHEGIRKILIVRQIGVWVIFQKVGEKIQQRKKKICQY